MDNINLTIPISEFEIIGKNGTPTQIPLIENLKVELENQNGILDELEETINLLDEDKNLAVAKGLADGTLTEFSAPNYGITQLAERRFYNFVNLKKLDLTGITELPYGTVHSCTNLEELILDENITKIGEYTFQDCPVPIKLFVKNCNIGNYAARGVNFTDLIGSAIKIGSEAFQGAKFKNIQLKINGAISGRAFVSLNDLETLEIDKNSVITDLSGNSIFTGAGTNVRLNNPKYWTLNFKNSVFTSIGSQCFGGSSSTKKIKNIEFYFPITVSTVGSNTFYYSDGFKIYWTSVPTLSNTNTFSSATNYKNFFPYQLVYTAKTATNWSSSTNGIVDSIYGYAEAGTFTLNETLPNIDANGYALTWYSDEDLTQEVQTVTDETATYYCIVSERTHVKLNITQLQVDVAISDGLTTYKNGDLVPVGTNLTVTTFGQGDNTEKYMFELNNVDITSGYTYTVGAVDISIVCIYWDGINVPVNSNFADNTAQQIKTAVDNGFHRILWNVGDTKTITLTDNSSATIRLTDTLANRYEKTDGTGYSNAVLEFTSITSKARMNPIGINSGGWPSSEMNTLTIADTLALLPQEWQDIISEVKIGSATSGSDSTIVYANNKCFLASGEEIFGSYRLGSNFYANETIGQFEYYVGKSDSDKIKQFEGKNAGWWLRSPYVGTSDSFITFTNTGGFGKIFASYSEGVSAFFAI